MGRLRFQVVVRAQRAEQICLELAAAGTVEALEAAEVQGSGTRVEGVGYSAMGLLPKVAIAGVIDANDLDDLLETIYTQGRTGRAGDGKVWITPVEAEIDL